MYANKTLQCLLTQLALKFLNLGKPTAADYGSKTLTEPLILVGAIGLEPTTPTMSRWCSNQLSYAPEETKFYLKQDDGSNYNGEFHQ